MCLQMKLNPYFCHNKLLFKELTSFFLFRVTEHTATASKHSVIFRELKLDQRDCHATSTHGCDIGIVKHDNSLLFEHLP